MLRFSQKNDMLGDSEEPKPDSELKSKKLFKNVKSFAKYEDFQDILPQTIESKKGIITIEDEEYCIKINWKIDTDLFIPPEILKNYCYKPPTSLNGKIPKEVIFSLYAVDYSGRFLAPNFIPDDVGTKHTKPGTLAYEGWGNNISKSFIRGHCSMCKTIDDDRLPLELILYMVHTAIEYIDPSFAD